jgi:hypothetical protein
MTVTKPVLTSVDVFTPNDFPRHITPYVNRAGQPAAGTPASEGAHHTERGGLDFPARRSRARLVLIQAPPSARSGLPARPLVQCQLETHRVDPGQHHGLHWIA